MSDRLTQRGRIVFTDETPHEFIQLVMSTLRESDFIHAEVELNLSHDDGEQVVVVVYELPEDEIPGKIPDSGPHWLETSQGRMKQSPAERVDPFTEEEWVASEEEMELERNFMRFVQLIHSRVPSRPGARWETGVEFRRKPGTRVREMDEWAFLSVRGGNATVKEAVDLGLPPEWFEGL